MSTWKGHSEDCERIIGVGKYEVHAWIDAFAKTHGALHRKFRHHRDGVREAETLFGRNGMKAAIIHILRDCGHVPTVQQWKDGTVDVFGVPALVSKGKCLLTGDGSFIGFIDNDQFDQLAKATLYEWGLL